MSAIEIMDPKMDAGMVCHRGRKVLQFQDAVKVNQNLLGIWERQWYTLFVIGSSFVGLRSKLSKKKC